MLFEQGAFYYCVVGIGIHCLVAQYIIMKVIGTLPCVLFVVFLFGCVQQARGSMAFLKHFSIRKHHKRQISAYREMVKKEKEFHPPKPFSKVLPQSASEILKDVRFANKHTVDHSIAQHLKQKMKIGGCKCDFLAGVSATKIVGSTAKCAPKTALCGFCMNAAWAAYWQPDVDSCQQYMMGAKGVCEDIASGAKAAKDDIGKLYEMYGPLFGASAVWCREQGCCNGEV